MHNIIIRFFLCSILIQISTSKADIHVYGLSDSIRTIKYESGMTALSLWQQYGPKGFSLLAPAWDYRCKFFSRRMLLFRSNNLYVVSFLSKGETEFMLQDDDVILFSCSMSEFDAIIKNIAEGEPLQMLYPLYTKTLPRIIKVNEARALGRKKGFTPQSEGLQFYKELQAIVNSQTGIAIEIKSSDTIEKLLQEEFGNRLEEYEFVCINNACIRLLHRGSGEVICRYIHNNKLATPDSDIFYSPTFAIFRFSFRDVYNGIEIEKEKSGLCCVPATEAKLYLTDYVAMRLYLHDDEEVVYLSNTKNDTILALIETSRDYTIYELTETGAFMLTNHASIESAMKACLDKATR